jgi:hypothetical protein
MCNLLSFVILTPFFRITNLSKHDKRGDRPVKTLHEHKIYCQGGVIIFLSQVIFRQFLLKMAPIFFLQIVSISRGFYKNYFNIYYMIWKYVLTTFHTMSLFIDENELCQLFLMKMCSANTKAI